MFEWLTELVGGSAWSYPVIVGAVALDCVLPLAPEEATVITAGILAGNGELSIVLVLAAAMAGGFLGDNVSYLLGATVGRRVQERRFKGEKAQRRLSWARQQLRERGSVMVVAGRFIPGGRTATTFAAGTLEFPWRRFGLADALAALLWAVYASFLGYFGGATFKESLWKPLAVAAVIAALVAVVGEGLRRVAFNASAEKTRG